MHVPETFFRNNVAESLQLLEVLVEQHVAKFVFSSTATVYGPGGTGRPQGGAAQKKPPKKKPK